TLCGRGPSDWLVSKWKPAALSRAGGQFPIPWKFQGRFAGDGPQQGAGRIDARSETRQRARIVIGHLLSRTFEAQLTAAGRRFEHLRQVLNLPPRPKTRVISEAGLENAIGLRVGGDDSLDPRLLQFLLQPACSTLGRLRFAKLVEQQPRVALVCEIGERKAHLAQQPDPGTCAARPAAPRPPAPIPHR